MYLFLQFFAIPIKIEKRENVNMIIYVFVSVGMYFHIRKKEKIT